jgi:5-methylcytosine-specific restriction protein A
MRLEFSRKVRAAIIARAKGVCEACTAVLKPGEGEVDHILPCALGGKPEAANGWFLCRVCHGEKTANDIRSVRKADRQRDKATGAVRPKASIPSRPKEHRPVRDRLPMPGPKQLFVERTD